MCVIRTLANYIEYHSFMTTSIYSSRATIAELRNLTDSGIWTRNLKRLNCVESAEEKKLS